MKKGFKVGDKAIWVEAAKLLSEYTRPGKIVDILRVKECTKYIVDFKYRFPGHKKWKKARLALPSDQLVPPAEANIINSATELAKELNGANLCLKMLSVLKDAEKAFANNTFAAKEKAIIAEANKLKKEALRNVKDAKKRQKEAEKLAQLIIKATIK
jgi:hypothetical protein